MEASTAPNEKNLAALSFEQAADELERLVEEMENRVLPLEEMLGHYERGVKLARQCAEKLSAAEKRIEIIKRLPDGEVTLAPLDADAEANLNPNAATGTEQTGIGTGTEPAPAGTRTRTVNRKPAAQATPPAPVTSSDHDPATDDDELSLF